MIECLALARQELFPLSSLLFADTATTLTWLPSITMIAGILIMGLIMAISFNRRERQLRTLAMQISNDLEEAKALRSQLDEAHTLASNMMVTAQRLSARLDERVAALDMASLRMSATRNALPKAQQAPVRRQATPVAASEVSLSPVLSSIEHAMMPTRVESPADSTPLSTVATLSPHAHTSVEFKSAPDSLTQHIYDMADAGRAPLDIACELNEQIGKVELILALRR